jgi:16S rRNA (uracil1498-N3)-methyltransferase
MMPSVTVARRQRSMSSPVLSSFILPEHRALSTVFPECVFLPHNLAMSNYRFHVPDLIAQAGSGTVRLPGDQAHHARTVLRLAAGEAVTLFDGRGAWADGTIRGLSKSELLVELQGGVQVDAPPTIALTIATAVPKGERAEWLVEQASQLNVGRIQWLDCDRSVVKPREGGGKIEKWRRLAIESAKQCHRTHVLEIAEPMGIDAFLPAAMDAKGRILWLEPRSDDSSRRISEAVRDTPGRITALVGPEGGWSEREFELLESAAGQGKLTRVLLTETVLRIETACAAIAAVVMS